MFGIDSSPLTKIRLGTAMTNLHLISEIPIQFFYQVMSVVSNTGVDKNILGLHC